MKLTAARKLTLPSAKKKARVFAFQREEDGAITILTCFLIFMMLIVCGIAIDLMRNEMTRTRVQNTLDRAILAASDLDQPLPPDDVVDDYFAKAGMSDFLQDVNITPGVELPTTNYRIVRAEARTRTESPYMGLTGVFDLPVYAVGTAEETIENTEISLVLDISGSMRNDGKIGNMRTAANQFIAAVLEGNAAPTTSLSIIPYAGQVNPGRDVFEIAGGNLFPTTYVDADGDEQIFGYKLQAQEDSDILDADGNPIEAGSDILDAEGNPIWIPWNSLSSCLEIEPTDFDNINLPSGGYDQTPHFMNWPIDWPTMDWGWCPQEGSSIRYAQNNVNTLQSFINSMRLHDGTGTHYGMKYAVALLNPSSRSTFQTLSTKGVVPESFAARPADFGDDDTRKVIVLMTDGQITDQYRPEFVVDLENASVVLNKRTGDRERATRRSDNLKSFYKMCDKAKAENIQIYTIAFEAPDNAVTEMRNCATAPAFFYNVEGVEISSAFKSIARQINQLRLTQ